MLTTDSSVVTTDFSVLKPDWNFLKPRSSALRTGGSVLTTEDAGDGNLENGRATAERGDGSFSARARTDKSGDAKWIELPERIPDIRSPDRNFPAHRTGIGDED